MGQVDELVSIEARLRKAGDHEAADIARKLMELVDR